MKMKYCVSNVVMPSVYIVLWKHAVEHKASGSQLNFTGCIS